MQSVCFSLILSLSLHVCLCANAGVHVCPCNVGEGGNNDPSGQVLMHIHAL